MTTTKITIKSKVAKNSKAGKPFWTIEGTDGKKYSVWDEEIASQCVDGDTVEVDVLKQDQYNNIKEFNKVLAHKPSFQNASEYKPENSSSYDVSYCKDIVIAMINKSEKLELDTVEAGKIAAKTILAIKETLDTKEKAKEEVEDEGQDY